MHALLFDLKRAYHASLRWTHDLLRKIGLTPARFDMMFALYDDDPRRRRLRIRHTVLQSELPRILGVSRTVVSRMLRSLETLGLVRRVPVRTGSHHLDVELTAEGFARVRCVMRRLIATGHIGLALDTILEPDAWHAEGRCVTLNERFEHRLLRLRKAGGDAATLVYAWHPDD